MSWLYEPEGGEHDLDESDVRIRPNPKGNRPRTKTRPEYKNAPVGMVTVNGMAFTVHPDLPVRSLREYIEYVRDVRAKSITPSAASAR